MIEYKVGDIIRTYTDDMKNSWRGTIKFVGPTIANANQSKIVISSNYNIENPALYNNQCWVEWDNGSSSRIDFHRIEYDKEHLRDKKLKDLGI